MFQYLYRSLLFSAISISLTRAQSTWVATACYSANLWDDTGYSFSPPRSGTITGIQLLNTPNFGRGDVSCDSEASTAYFGCDSNFYVILSKAVANSNPLELTDAFPTAETLDVSITTFDGSEAGQTWYYSLAGSQPTETSFALDGPVTSVSTDDEFYLIFSEEVYGVQPNSAGDACADVYFEYEPTPAPIPMLTIPTEPTDVVVTPQSMPDGICYSAATFDETLTFNPPYDGTVSGIKLIYKTGTVTCNGRSDAIFGCLVQGIEQFMVNLYLLNDATPGAISITEYYPTDSTTNVAVTNRYTACELGTGCDIHFYSVDDPVTGAPYSIDDTEIEFSGPSYDVSTSDDFLLVFNEAFAGSATVLNGNGGNVCVDVVFIYTTAVGTPSPVAVTPSPVAVTPAPVAVTPAPVAVTPAPVAVTPAPVAVTPSPVAVTPAPVAASVFFVGPTGGTWAECRTYCQDNGGDLASIHSVEEFDEAQGVMDDGGYTNCYFGMRKANALWGYTFSDNSENDYGFVGGDPTTGVLPWAPDNPSTVTNERCGEWTGAGWESQVCNNNAVSLNPLCRTTSAGAMAPVGRKAVPTASVGSAVVDHLILNMTSYLALVYAFVTGFVLAILFTQIKKWFDNRASTFVPIPMVDSFGFEAAKASASEPVTNSTHELI